MSNLIDHARLELKKAGLFDMDSNYGGLVGDAVLELITVFSKQGHSGGSAEIVSEVFNRVLTYLPLCPITGDDDEWDEITDSLLQNKRCSAIFKDKKTGVSTYIDAITLVDDRGGSWGGSAIDKNGKRISSTQEIKFPFTPESVKVAVVNVPNGVDDGDFHVKDQKQLENALAQFGGLIR